LQDHVAEAGRITNAELERLYELIDDPSFSVNSYTLVSARTTPRGVTTAGPS
jgi:hypothetical protein